MKQYAVIGKQYAVPHITYMLNHHPALKVLREASTNKPVTKP